MDLFRSIDENGDGAISRVHWAGAFDRLDGDNDGSISRKEWFSKGGDTQLFDDAKGGLHGNITRKQWLRFFDELDLDGDSIVTRPELEARKLRDAPAPEVRLPQHLQEHFPQGTEDLIICMQVAKRAAQTAEVAIQRLEDRLRCAADPSDAALRLQLRKEMVGHTRSALLDLSNATTAAQTAVGHFTDQTLPTSRAGYLSSLTDLIGPPPTNDEWRQHEIPDLIAEGLKGMTPPDLSETEWQQATEALLQGDLFKNMQDQGMMDSEKVSELARSWQATEDDVRMMFALATIAVAPLGVALRERSPKFAGVTHFMCEFLANRSASATIAPRMLYCPLRGDAFSLVRADPAWDKIEVADATGFQGIVCSSGITATCEPAEFDKGVLDGTGDLVAFAPADADEQGGQHSPIMLDQGLGLFPPNVLYRLLMVLEAPFRAIDSEGEVHTINQRCLVVSATFRPPSSKGSAHAGGKMAGNVNTLRYGDRSAYIRGLQDVVAKPMLTMAQEFQRDHKWADRKGVEYSLHQEWDYVNGPAVPCAGCTPGTRDADNTGTLPDGFRARINGHIRSRRVEGYGLELSAQYAELTIEEVLAVRLYTGPAFAPINTFLRQIADLQGLFRATVCTHVEVTFSATIGHLCHAVRKICAVTTPEEAEKPLFRGVAGVLPKSFWYADNGVVCATDTAFMSTSRNRNTPIAYMGRGSNVLWEVCTSAPSDSAYHRGADVAMLSQFAFEDEVLFPPCTLLMAKTVSTPRVHPAAGEHSELRGLIGNVDAMEDRKGDKTFIAIKVRPHFV